MKKALIVLALPVLIVVAVFIVLNATNQGASSARVESSPEYLPQWLGVDFTGVANSPGFHSFVADIPTSGNASLTSEQRVELDHTLLHFMLYNHASDFEHFREFRFASSKGTFNSNLMAFSAQQLVKAGVPTGQSPMQTIKLVWENVEIPYRASRGGTWTHVALPPTTRIHCDRWLHSPPPLRELAANRPNDGVLDLYSHFHPTPTPLALIKAHGELLVADFSTIAKQASGTAGPVYLRCYWEPDQRLWIAWELVKAGTDAFQPPFF